MRKYPGRAFNIHPIKDEPDGEKVIAQYIVLKCGIIVAEHEFL